MLWNDFNIRGSPFKINVQARPEKDINLGTTFLLFSMLFFWTINVSGLLVVRSGLLVVRSGLLVVC